MQGKDSFKLDLLYAFFGTLFTCSFTGLSIYFSFWYGFVSVPIYYELYGKTDQHLSVTGSIVGCVSIVVFVIALIFKRKIMYVFAFCILFVVFLLVSISSLFRTKKLTKTIVVDNIRANYKNFGSKEFIKWEKQASCHGLESINGSCSKDAKKENIIFIDETVCCDETLKTWGKKSTQIFNWFFTYFMIWFGSSSILTLLCLCQKAKTVRKSFLKETDAP